MNTGGGLFRAGRLVAGLMEWTMGSPTIVGATEARYEEIRRWAVRLGGYQPQRAALEAQKQSPG